MTRHIAEFLYVAVRYPHSPSGLQGKACVCGTPLSSRIAEPLSNCCSHNPSPLESSNTNKMCVWMCVMLLCMWMCVLLSCLWWSLLSWSWSVLWLSCVCFCGYYVPTVMCPMLCTQCESLVVHRVIFVVFHPSTCGPQNTSVRYRKISFSLKHPVFPIADETVKLSGGDQRLRTSTLIRDSPDRGEEQDNLQGESEVSSSTSRQDSSWYDDEAKDYFSLSQENLFTRVKLYVPTEESFPISTKIYRHYQDHGYILGCVVGET